MQHINNPQKMPVIVEFTGVTGVGKSTLINSVEAILSSEGFLVKEAYDFILESYGINYFNNLKIRSLLIDVIAFFPFLAYSFTKRGMSLIHLAIISIINDADNWYTAINLLRNVPKRIGVHILLDKLRNKHTQDGNLYDFILYDEGILHIAHNIFVHVNAVPDNHKIEKFIKLVPKPDVVIWVRADKQQSIDCTLNRGHKRVNNDINLVKKFVENAYLTFNKIFTHSSIHNRILIVENSINKKNYSQKNLANQLAIADFIKSVSKETIKC